MYQFQHGWPLRRPEFSRHARECRKPHGTTCGKQTKRLALVQQRQSLRQGIVDVHGGSRHILYVECSGKSLLGAGGSTRVCE
jgi:hypothetical protein